MCLQLPGGGCSNINGVQAMTTISPPVGAKSLSPPMRRPPSRRRTSGTFRTRRSAPACRPRGGVRDDSPATRPMPKICCRTRFLAAYRGIPNIHARDQPPSVAISRHAETAGSTTCKYAQNGVLPEVTLDGITDRELAGDAGSDPARPRAAEFEAFEVIPDSRIAAALGALPGRQRLVVYYADIEGFTYAETAQMLGIPLGTAISRLSRAGANGFGSHWLIWPRAVVPAPWLMNSSRNGGGRHMGAGAAPHGENLCGDAHGPAVSRCRRKIPLLGAGQPLDATAQGHQVMAKDGFRLGRTSPKLNSRNSLPIVDGAYTASMSLYHSAVTHGVESIDDAAPAHIAAQHRSRLKPTSRR